MDTFEAALDGCMSALERFVKYRIGDKYDAEDIIQETCLTAYQKFASLKNKASFKAWIISIARNKCNDYYRSKAERMDISLELLSESVLTASRSGITVRDTIGETLDRLGSKDKQILYLYFFKELPQDEIARRLGLPLGTVKSRLYYAKKSFKEKYPYQHSAKGEKHMKKLPDIMPEYKIERSDTPAFSVKWEEIMGWFIVPKLGEKLSWAMYDHPGRGRTEICHMKVVGRAEVHGIEGVEIESTELEPMECNSAGGQKEVERRFVAQLTDTHCRLLAESHTEGGIKRYYTFLDGDSFLNNWGFGEDNCGNEVDLVARGDITRDGSVVTTKDKEFLLDVVGRYTVTICGKVYDTVCVMDCYTYNEGVVSEQYIDKNGRTILWRRFNRNDWACERYGKPWSEMLPENERIVVNGETYVHWYDCITDYVM
ncbi:MAG: RNA polymerase sigma factor [Clostridia bacterium]|nr:RNA polymerase sigma factor [Clostridia bacterium]